MVPSTYDSSVRRQEDCALSIAGAALTEDVSSAVAQVYDEHAELLSRIAIGRFSINPEDAETLVHDVFLSFMLRRSEILDVRAWLVGAISNASRHYHRRYDRLEALPDDYEATTADSQVQIETLLARDCLSCITPRCRLALQLRYVEGYSVAEVAAELDVTPKYAQKLIGVCIRQARKRYGGMA
jgi:RNA polymerase sigma factor (sigma-70 family)